MVTENRRNFMKTLGAVGGTALIGTGTAAANSDSNGNHGNHKHSHQNCTQIHRGTPDPLVGTWTASVSPPGNSGHSRTGFKDQTLRQIVHTSVGGSKTRIRLSNTYGNRPVTFNHVEIGIRDDGASVVAGTNELVTFGGQQQVTIPPGAMAYSDVVPLSVEPDQDLTVSMYTATATGPASWHPLAITTSYLSGGDDASSISGDPYSKKLMSWYFLEGIDVVPEHEDTSAIVALGNSITDGFQANQKIDKDHPYPYYLARRINDNPDIHKSVLNAGISGNRVLTDSGTAGVNVLARLNRDVIAQPGVSDVILLEGINDIGYASPNVTAEQIIGGLKQIGIRCHAHGIDVYAATLTPTRGTGGNYSSPEGEAKREIVNEFIRSGEFFDGVIDFDSAIQDPDQPDRILPKYDSGGHLHPSNLGYKKMAQTVDLSLFDTECGCENRNQSHDEGKGEGHEELAPAEM